ncbi:hypothetical protein FH972_010505 [Carpinus fangiana]|uniref:Uncharacterized protein n=1 Tax=Carpinus fangiana TaxID=176857 RepID=A0A660KRP2_9ROSI|nr:hypothetical protein FH972_010505 [Carpinus fangiana]
MGSTTTSNNSAVFAVDESTLVSPNLKNEDVESIAFTNNEAASVVEDITHISPNVKNEAGKGDLGYMKFDFNASHCGFLSDNQCKKPSDLTDSCKIQMTS